MKDKENTVNKLSRHFKYTKVFKYKVFPYVLEKKYIFRTPRDNNDNRDCHDLLRKRLIQFFKTGENKSLQIT